MARREKVFILFIVLLNLIQATMTGLSGDEALYWMYSRNPALGYKDHPPMIGLFNGLGYLLFKSELGVRLMIVLAQAVTLWTIFKLVQPGYSKWFLVAVFSLPILHVYGFVATPDAPLLMFTGLYLVIWKSFLTTQSFRNTFLLGLLMSALVWSKYHGILVILLLLFPCRKMWFNRKFWLSTLLAVVLFIPHIVWQIQNDLPTVKFQLVQRSGNFSFEYVWDFLGGELLVFNPVLIGILIWILFRTKAANDFERSAKWMVSGFLLFFLLCSTRGRVEPHWTAAISIPVLVFICAIFRKENISPWLKASLIFLSLLIVVGRINVITGSIPALAREFTINREKVERVKSIAGESPVCFINSYQDPSLYMFYTGTDAHSINNIEGGKNQYDFWDYGQSIHQHKFLWVSNSPMKGFSEVKVDERKSVFVKWENDFPVAGKLYLRTSHWEIKAKGGERVQVDAELINNNQYDLDFDDPAHQFYWKGVFNYKKDNQQLFDVNVEPFPDKILAGERIKVRCSFIVPDMQGTNRGAIALGIDQTNMTYQSNRIRLVIKE